MEAQKLPAPGWGVVVSVNCPYRSQLTPVEADHDGIVAVVERSRRLQKCIAASRHSQFGILSDLRLRSLSFSHPDLAGRDVTRLPGKEPQDLGIEPVRALLLELFLPRIPLLLRVEPQNCGSYFGTMSVSNTSATAAYLRQREAEVWRQARRRGGKGGV